MSKAPRLQFDLGNSRVKWRLLAGGEILVRGAGTLADRAWRDAPVSPVAVEVASVASEATEAQLAAAVREQWGLDPWFARPVGCTGDLVSSYAEPERLGVDRWLAMLAARARCRERLCVVDAGSALTIDLVAADGRHEGGYIVPGDALMQRALRGDTDRVRFEGSGRADLSPGTSTAACVHNGIALAMCGALSLALEAAEASGPRPHLFLTGGDAHRIVSVWPALPVQLVDDLVLEGLALARVAPGPVSHL